MPSLEQKKILVIGGVVLVVLAIGGYFLFSKKTTSVPVEQKAVVEEEQAVIPTIAPEDLDLTFTARSDSKAVKFTISNTAGIQSVDYEISYLAKGDIPRGAIGHLDVKPSEKTVSTNYIDLGTCSSGKCKYDEGVTEVKLLLKIVKDDGKTYSTETSLDL